MELEANNMCYLLIHGGPENYINELEPDKYAKYLKKE